MAFVQANLSLVAYSGNGFHIWHYTSTDAKAAIDSAGYFNAMANEMNMIWSACQVQIPTNGESTHNKEGGSESCPFDHSQNQKRYDPYSWSKSNSW